MTNQITLRVLRPLRPEERAAKEMVKELAKRQIFKAQELYDRMCRELAEGVADA